MRHLLRTLFVGFILALTACAAQRDFVWFSAVPAQQLPEVSSIAPGDKILITVAQHPELSGEFDVGASGSYSQPLAGLIRVAGNTPAAAGPLVSAQLSRFIASPEVEVSLLSRKPITVTVLGEVRTPGTFTLSHGSNILVALGHSGGLSDFANEDRIFLLRPNPNSKRIRFRYVDLTSPGTGASRFALVDGDAIVVE